MCGYVHMSSGDVRDRRKGRILWLWATWRVSPFKERHALLTSEPSLSLTTEFLKVFFGDFIYEYMYI